MGGTRKKFRYEENTGIPALGCDTDLTLLGFAEFSGIRREKYRSVRCIQIWYNQTSIKMLLNKNKTLRTRDV